MTEAAKPVIGHTIDGSSAQLNPEQLIWRPSVYALIFDHQDRILLVDNYMNGKKHFPGGGLEINESLLDGLRREVWEEVGLQIEVEKLILVDDDFYITPAGSQWHVLLYYYRARVVGGTLRDSILDDEISGNPHWVDPQMLTPEDFSASWQALQAALGS